MSCIRRACHSALSAAGRPSQFANGSRRAFSRSCARERGALPVFQEPSSPELSTLLARCNSRVLLPLHLTPEQQQLVYKKENIARLEAEPIEITLGDVTLPLEHIDRNVDQPARWDALKQVLIQSKTTQDWDNFLRLLEGYKDAGIHVTPEQFQMIIQRLHNAGEHRLLLKVLQRANKTGLSLRLNGVAQCAFNVLHSSAAQSGWDELETDKMLRFAEQFTDMMEDGQHLGKVSAALNTDPRSSPFIIAVPLSLAAVRAVKYQDGQDTNGQIRKLAGRLVNAIAQDSTQTGGQRVPNALAAIRDYAPHAKPHKHNAAISELKQNVRELLPVWSALNRARQVLGDVMPEAALATKSEQDIKSAIDKAVAILQSEEKGGFKTNAKLMVESVEQCEKL